MPRACPDSSTEAEDDWPRKPTCVVRDLQDRLERQTELKVKAKVTSLAFEIAKVFARTNARGFSEAEVETAAKALEYRWVLLASSYSKLTGDVLEGQKERRSVFLEQREERFMGFRQ